MTYFPIPVEQFGGLNLADDPGEVGFSGAIDLLDVDVDRSGRLRSRDMFSTLVANTTLTDPSIVGWGRQPLTNPAFIVSTAAALRLYNSAGTLVGVQQVAPCQYFPGSVQAIGTPSNSYLYLADQTNLIGGGVAIRRLTTGGVISAPAGMPKAAFLSRTPADNRLVAAAIDGNPHRVQFSDPGDPETWGANNYVDLDPGDGESIASATTWGNTLFVFKQTKFYAFYGTSTDSSGNPIFNYRTVRTNVGGNGVGAVQGHDGLYFWSTASRLHRTTGGVADHLSRPVDPTFRGTQPASFSLGQATLASYACFVEPWVHTPVTATGTANKLLLSYNTEVGYWKVTNVNTSTFVTSLQINGIDRLLVAGTGANAKVFIEDPTAVADTLVTPGPYYQSGFESLAPPRRYIDKYGFGPSRKRVRSWRVAGSGTVTMSVAADEGALKGATSLTLGTSPAIAEARYSNAIRGAKISYKLSGVGPWSVNDLVAMLADTRQPGSDVSDG